MGPSPSLRSLLVVGRNDGRVPHSGTSGRVENRCRIGQSWATTPNGVAGATGLRRLAQETIKGMVAWAVVFATTFFLPFKVITFSVT